LADCKNLDYRVEFLTVEALDNALMGDTTLLEAMLSAIADKADQESEPAFALVDGGRDQPCGSDSVEDFEDVEDGVVELDELDE
jgi:hypothetical protein